MILLYILGGILALLLLYALFVGVCALLVRPKKDYDSNSPFYRFVLNSATWLTLRLLRIRVHVTGKEKLSVGTRLLFVGNHRSNFDPIVTWYAFRQWRIAYVSKPENFKLPLFGRIIHRCGFLPIDRENPRRALTTVNKAAKRLKSGELSIGIYPEGTRNKNGGLLPFHNGVFKIAQKADAPIAVVYVTGTQEVHKRTPFKRTHVYVEVLEVFSHVQGNTEMIGAAVRHLLQSQIQKER